MSVRHAKTRSAAQGNETRAKETSCRITKKRFYCRQEKKWPPSVINARLNELHFFGSGLGVDRLCGCTVTAFGPGFPPSRLGTHFTLLAISYSPPPEPVLPLSIGNRHPSRREVDGDRAERIPNSLARVEVLLRLRQRKKRLAFCLIVFDLVRLTIRETLAHDVSS